MCAVGRTPCSCLWWCLVDAESLGAHSACCDSWRLLLSSWTRKMGFSFSFLFFRVGKRWRCLLQFFWIVEFYTLEARTSVYIAVPLLTALSQTYSHCLTMSCCFTGPLQVKTTSEELTSTSGCKEVTTFLCYFQSHLSIKYNLWCFLHQGKKLLRAETDYYSLHSIGQHKTRPPGTAVCNTTQIMEVSLPGQEGRVFLWAFRISGLVLQHPASSKKLWTMWLI